MAEKAQKELHEVLSEAAENDFELPGNDDAPDNDDGDEGDGKDDAAVAAEKATAEAEEADKGGGQGADEGDPLEDTSWLDNPNIKEETRQRFNTLLDDRKKLKQDIEQRQREHAEAQQQLEYWNNQVQQGQLSRDDIQFMVETNRLLKSSNLQDRVAGYERIKQLHGNLSQELGYATDTFDPLTQFPDLQQRVQQYAISASDAREIARGRIQQTLAQREQQTTQAQREQQAGFQAQVQQVVNQASSEVVAFEQHMQQNDPDYAAKQPHLVAAMQRLVDNRVDPRAWSRLIQGEYEQVTAILKEKAAVQQRAGRQPNPLRPSGSNAAGSKAEAKTMLDALTNGLEDIRSGTE